MRTQITGKTEKSFMNLVRKSSCLVEFYNMTDDSETIKDKMNTLYLELASARYDMPRTEYLKLKHFIENCLGCLPELKLFAQYSFEVETLFKNGPMKYEDAVTEAKEFAKSMLVSNEKMNAKYSEGLLQALERYYITLMCNTPDCVDEIIDRKAYEIVAEKIYKFLDNLVGEFLTQI